MITKGYIVDKVEDSPGKFLVRLPVYEVAGEETEEAIFEALVSYVTGNLNTYEIGDCVFVGSEDNDPGKLIILGKLYLGGEEKASASQNAETLNVEGTTQLSKDTYVGGVRIDQAFASKTEINQVQQSMITYRLKYDSEGNLVT